MKTAGEDTSLPLPPALPAQVRAAAEEEHRSTSEVVREAVERYLENRRRTMGQSGGQPGTVEAALTAAAQIRELRKGNILPEGVTIRDLIDEGR